MMSAMPPTEVPRRRRRVQMAKWIVLTAILVGLPFVGAYAAGHPLTDYLEFPPKLIGPRLEENPPLAWLAWIGYAVFIGAVTVPVAWRWLRGAGVAPHAAAAGRFPWWGWGGVVLGAVAWVLAWTRFPWFHPFQKETFVLLWLSYLLVANAFVERRTGSASFVRSPRRYVALFAASAVFWWGFEYLNRFARNWRYVGVDFHSAASYAIAATLAFSTVLPAYYATYEWIAASPRFDAAFANWRPLRLSRPRAAAAAALLLSAAGLVLLGLRPDLLFPLVWVSPVLVFVGIQTLRGRPHVLSGLAHGDWRKPVAAAAAALVCGFFWEMWNSGSEAKWQYDIPYVGRFHVFEMPVLGYAGYLPFGLMCAAVADAVMPARAESPSAARAIDSGGAPSAQAAACTTCNDR
jgi:hypothetical protein